MFNQDGSEDDEQEFEQDNSRRNDDGNWEGWVIRPREVPAIKTDDDDEEEAFLCRRETPDPPQSPPEMVKIVAIDVGVVHLGIAIASLPRNTLRLRPHHVVGVGLYDITQIPHKNVLRKNCPLHHSNELSDRLEHLLQEESAIFANVDLFLVEQQPPQGLKAVEQFFFQRFRDRIRLMSPNHVQNCLEYVAIGDYDQRKEDVTEIAMPFLRPHLDKMEEGGRPEPDRLHDMADAIALLICHLKDHRRANVEINRRKAMLRFKPQSPDIARTPPFLETTVRMRMDDRHAENRYLSSARSDAAACNFEKFKPGMWAFMKAAAARSLDSVDPPSLLPSPKITSHSATQQPPAPGTVPFPSTTQKGRRSDKPLPPIVVIDSESEEQPSSLPSPATAKGSPLPPAPTSVKAKRTRPSASAKAKAPSKKTKTAVAAVSSPPAPDAIDNSVVPTVVLPSATLPATDNNQLLLQLMSQMAQLTQQMQQQQAVLQAAGLQHLVPPSVQPPTAPVSLPTPTPKPKRVRATTSKVRSKEMKDATD